MLTTQPESTIKVVHNGVFLYYKADTLCAAYVLVGMLTQFMGNTGTAEILKDN